VFVVNKIIVVYLVTKQEENLHLILISFPPSHLNLLYVKKRPLLHFKQKKLLFFILRECKQKMNLFLNPFLLPKNSTYGFVKKNEYIFCFFRNFMKNIVTFFSNKFNF